MPRFALLHPLRDAVTRWVRDRRGVAAVEFALILPVLTVMYLGLTQLTQGVIIDRKVTLLARTLADLTAQAQNVDETAIENIFNASRAVLQPVDTTPAKMLIVSLYIDKDKKVSICWGDARNGMPIPSAVSLPTGLIVPESSLVMAKAAYDFDAAAKLIPGKIELEEVIYMRPRFPPQVTRIGSDGKSKACKIS